MKKGTQSNLKILLLRSADMKFVLDALDILHSQFVEPEIDVLVQKNSIEAFNGIKPDFANIVSYPYRDFNLAPPEESLTDLRGKRYDLALAVYKNQGEGYEEVDAFLVRHVDADRYGGIRADGMASCDHISADKKRSMEEKALKTLYGDSPDAAIASDSFSKKHCPASSRVVFSGDAKIVIDEGGKFEIAENTIFRIGATSPEWRHVRGDSKTVIRIQNGATFKVNGSSLFFNGVKINVFPAAEFAIGEGSYMAFDSKIFVEKSVVIGRNCAISWDVEIIDTDFHRINLSDKGIGRAGIKLDDYAWIGAGATILKGVHLGRNALVAARSVVTKSFPENAIAAGNPAKQIGEKQNEFRI